ncbi:hypothetical protein DFH08DRAFT_972420 [Mycena albidolilacea]|uniref:Uncharacterized protein n=1 Tax=Mycena albidolilacea TaxID=1033008 RepID=A0AAD7EDM9_9AGAR|nr:hypothetical protein DFH08DRAFT_972420 [Mycena albidolilacea]
MPLDVCGSADPIRLASFPRSRTLHFRDDATSAPLSRSSQIAVHVISGTQSPQHNSTALDLLSLCHGMPRDDLLAVPVATRLPIAPSLHEGGERTRGEEGHSRPG